MHRKAIAQRTIIDPLPSDSNEPRLIFPFGTGLPRRSSHTAQYRGAGRLMKITRPVANFSRSKQVRSYMASSLSGKPSRLLGIIEDTTEGLLTLI